MGERLRRTAARQPGRAVGVLAAVAVLGTALAAGWTERLALTTNAATGAPLGIRVSGELPTGSAAFRVAVRTMRSQLAANPAVADVEERSRQRRSTVLVVRFAVDGRKRDAAISRIERGLDPGPLTLTFRGQSATVGGAKDAAIGDLYLVLFALPLVALLAVSVLGVQAGAVALLAAGAASALSALISEVIAGATDVSWLALVGAATGGSLVALALCAMARAGMDALTIWVAALAGAAPFAASTLLGVDYLNSLGIGGALAALFAAPASLLAGGASGTDGLRGGRGWRWVGEVLTWSRLIAFLVGVLAMAVLAFAITPADGLMTAAIGAVSAPRIETARLAIAIGAACLAVALLTAVRCRRAGLAISGSLIFALPAATTVGMMVAALQEGLLDGALDYRSSGSLYLGSLVAAVVTVAALGAAHLVALAGTTDRAKGPSKARGVAGGMAVVGPVMTLSCLTGVIFGAALCFSSQPFLKEFGFGLAAGLLLELAVVGVLLAPGLLRLVPRSAGDG